MGSKNEAPPPPDLSGVANASKEAAELSYKLGQDQLAWAREQFASNKEVTDEVIDRLLESQDQTNQNAREDRERYEQTFQPLEDDLVRDAKDYNTAERREAKAGQAMAGVGQAFDAARDAATRSLESYGVNPASTRFAALDIGTRAQEAAAKAGAGNAAREQVEANARALRSEAINIGRGYPGQVLAGVNTANNAGTGAVNSGLAQTASGANTMGTGAQYMGLGNQAVGTWGNTLNQGYANQLNAWKANQESSSGIGGALGLAAGMLTSAIPGGSIAGRLLGFNEGGAVPDPEATPGGAIPMAASPSQGQAVDDVPAQLTAGEFVIPKDVTSWFGEQHFQKMIQKARQDKQKATAKPAIGAAPAQAPTFQSRPGAIPMRQAA